MPEIPSDSIPQPATMASTPQPDPATRRPSPVNPDDAGDSAQGDEVPDEDIEPADTTAEDDEDQADMPAKRG